MATWRREFRLQEVEGGDLSGGFSGLTEVSSTLWLMALGKFFLVDVVDFSFPRSHDAKPQIKAISTNRKVTLAF